MNGKPNFKIKSPDDLFKLPSDAPEKVLSSEDANKMLLESGIVKQK